MSSILKEFWLFTKDGLPILEFCSQESIDKSFIGGFVSAIKSYSQQLSKKGLKSLLLEDNKFTFISVLDGNAIMVCRTDDKIKDKKIQKVCNEISSKIEKLYSPEDINNWSGERVYFDKLRTELDSFFKNR